MADRVIRRRSETGRSQAESSPARRSSDPVLALQRSIGNRAVGQVLARDPVRTGTVQIGAVGQIKVKGGNLEDWDGTESFDTVELTSQKGKHSAKLQKLANAGIRTNVKVTIAPANKAGEQLSVGGGTLLEIENARVTDYAVDHGVETWRLGDFHRVRRTKITHKIS
jgi:hypothetical protein